MNLSVNLRMALISLNTNKFRSALTLLGIVIGVSAVISLMAIGEGVQQTITSRIESLGTNLLFIRPGESSENRISRGQGSAQTLTLDDAKELQSAFSSSFIAGVAPESTTSKQIVWGKNNTSTRIVGVTPEYQSVRNYSLQSGEFIEYGHIENNAQVAVLGSRVSETLFGLRNPVGQQVKIGGRPFQVVGLLESKGSTGSFGFLDDQVLVPITTSYHRLSSQRSVSGGITVQTINVQIAESVEMERAIQEISILIRQRHRIEGNDDFTITNQQETIETLKETTNIFVIFLGAIASISLLVGGIGIMNIMLVSVTERTREIGIRKALGAKRIDILGQFVTEATVLSLGGGIIGVLVGLFFILMLDGKPIFGDRVLETGFSSQIAILSLAVSAGIGLFFGIYPALRASRLNPIDALRYD